MAQRIMLALLLGFLLGIGLRALGLEAWAPYFEPVSDIFLRLLRMIIVPLVFCSIYMAVIGLGSSQQLEDMGKKAMGYYFVTTCVAILIGIILINIFRPGVGSELVLDGTIPDAVFKKVSETQGLYQTIIGVLIDSIPMNPFQAMAEGNILQVIVLSMILGIVAIYFREKARPLTNLIKSLEEITLIITHQVMKLAPYGVGVLMMSTVVTSGVGTIQSLAQYMFVVLFGLLIHCTLLLLLGSWRSKKSPFFIIKSITTPLMTAFSTSSSAAALPLTMTSMQDNLKTRKKVGEFVLPLGATINMDGTALYESVAVIFIAQVYGIELTFANQATIFVTCSLAAIGAAAIPGAGLITMSIVLKAVGLPLNGIGIILAVDRILDQFRTATNVLGDCVGTLVVDSWLEDNPEEKKNENQP